MIALTARQQEIYEFIKAHILREHCPPTYREIGRHFGIKSPNGVTTHLKALEKKGVIELRGMPRSSHRIKLV